MSNSQFADYRYTYQQPALGKVGQYQMSGVPWISSSIRVPVLGEVPDAYGFSSVTKFVTITNTNTGTNVPLRVGFSMLGVTGSSYGEGGLSNDGGNSYFVLDNGESYTGEWRVSAVYLLSDTVDVPTSASIIAGLTGISAEMLPDNWSGSSGVG